TSSPWKSGGKRARVRLTADRASLHGEGCRNSDPGRCGAGDNDRNRLPRRIGPSLGYVGGLVLVSLCYALLRWLLGLMVLRVRSTKWKDLEIVVLRHELAILRRSTRRPTITAIDR